MLYNNRRLISCLQMLSVLSKIVTLAPSTLYSDRVAVCV